MNLIDFGMKYHAPLGGWIMIFLIYGGTVGTKLLKQISKDSNQF